MSLKYPQMVELLKQIATDLIGKTLKNCYESPSYYIHFTFEDNKNLLICLKIPFLRFHLTKYLPNSLKTDLTKSIEEKIKNFPLSGMQLLNEDRILELTFTFGKQIFYIIVELFSKKPNLYLLDSLRKIIFSYNKTDKIQYEIPSLHCSQHQILNDPISSLIVEDEYQKKERTTAFEEKKEKLLQQVRSQLKIAQRQKAKAMSSLKDCLKWEEVQHRALLLQSCLYKIKKGMAEISSPDWTLNNQEVLIALDPKIDPKITIEKNFKQSKKLREGINHWKPLLEKAESTLVLLQSKIDAIKSATHLEEIKLFDTEKISKKKLDIPKIVLPYRQFHSSTGTEIWVGKSAKDNDVMTFKCAKGSDWWLHVNDYAGSHVIIKVQKGTDPDQTTLQEAVQLAIKYSKAKDLGIVDVCVTQCKYLSRIGKNNPGKVSLSQHRLLRGAYSKK